MRTITYEEAAEYYKEYLPTLDHSADLLSDAEKAEIRQDAKFETSLYMLALDWNISITVLKQVLRG